MTHRVDFYERTKRVIAGRAGYRCSFPGCGRVTIGPGHALSEIASIGVAAHIFSAAAGGPRGQGNLSEEELRSSENGIWLCENHAKTVDNNRGTQYPASLLLSYKGLHEARISRELGDVVTPFGWIEELTLDQSPLFQTPGTLRFSKATLIMGQNGTGKSALCEWIAGAVDPRHLQRWLGSSEGSLLRYSLKYSDVTTHKVELALERDEIKYAVDFRPTPYNPLSFGVILLREPPRRQRLPIVKRLAYQLSVEPLIIRNLALEVGRNPATRARNILIRRNKIVSIDVDGTVPGLSFEGLSGGEQACVQIEFAIALARFSSSFRPTLLILDAAISGLDTTLLRHYLVRLLSPQSQFQTVVTTVLPATEIPWVGWEAVSLSGRSPDIKIELREEG